MSPLFDSSMLQLSPLSQLSPPMLLSPITQMPPSPSSASNAWAQGSSQTPSFTAQGNLSQPIQTPLSYEGQMLSMLLNDKTSAKLFNEWQADTPVGTLIDGQVYAFDTNSAFKKHSPPSTPLQTPKNSTRLFPPPVAVFDKQRFQLLDANEAMATFVGHTSVGDLSTVVMNMDDLLSSETADMARDAYTNFVMNPLACYPIGEVRTRSGNKTVEFNIDLTDQLLILTFKSVFDTYSMGLPDVPRQPVKSDIHFTSSTQQCTCKACEFLSPID